MRREHHKLKRYLHLGTGNYNPSRGKLYADYSLFTTNEQLGNELPELFNALTAYSKHTKYRKLLVSPINTRTRIIEVIEREIELSLKENKGKIDKTFIQIVKVDLDLILSDNVKSWQMNADGTSSLIANNEPKINSQVLFLTRFGPKKLMDTNRSF